MTADSLWIASRVFRSFQRLFKIHLHDPQAPIQGFAAIQAALRLPLVAERWYSMIVQEVHKCRSNDQKL